MNGINSVAYYLSLFLLDCILSSFIVTAIIISQLYMWQGQYAFVFVQKSQIILLLVGLTCLWSCSFIS